MQTSLFWKYNILHTVFLKAKMDSVNKTIIQWNRVNKNLIKCCACPKGTQYTSRASQVKHTVAFAPITPVSSGGKSQGSQETLTSIRLWPQPAPGHPGTSPWPDLLWFHKTVSTSEPSQSQLGFPKYLHFCADWKWRLPQFCIFPPQFRKFARGTQRSLECATFDKTTF